MKMYSKEGSVLMETVWIRREGDILVMKGKMMEAIPSLIYVRPEEIWRGRKLLSWSILLYMPVLLFKGFWRNLTKKTTPI